MNKKSTIAINLSLRTIFTSLTWLPIPKQTNHAEAEPFLRGTTFDRVLINRTRTISTKSYTLIWTRWRTVALAGLQKIFCVSRGLVRRNMTSTTCNFPLLGIWLWAPFSFFSILVKATNLRLPTRSVPSHSNWFSLPKNVTESIFPMISK